MKKTVWISLLVLFLSLNLASCSLFTAKIKKTINLVEYQIKVTKAFGEQIQAVWVGTEDKEEKINAFETAMDDMIKAYYDYYSKKGEAGIDQAKKELTEFLTKLEAEGAHLSENSIPLYMERFNKLIKPKP